MRHQSLHLPTKQRHSDHCLQPMTKFSLMSPVTKDLILCFKEKKYGWWEEGGGCEEKKNASDRKVHGFKAWTHSGYPERTEVEEKCTKLLPLHRWETKRKGGTGSREPRQTCGKRFVRYCAPRTVSRAIIVTLCHCMQSLSFRISEEGWVKRVGWVGVEGFVQQTSMDWDKRQWKPEFLSRNYCASLVCILRTPLSLITCSR